MTIPTFETTFNVPMSCEACVKEVKTTLHSLQGISRVEADLKLQLISIEGNAAPSSIVKAIQDTGRDAILRGSGSANSAAVCILETHAPVKDYVKGLIRMVQVAPRMTLFDVTIRGLSPGQYLASIREAGDISKGPESTGRLWEGPTNPNDDKPARAILGTIQVTKGGVGSLFVDKPIEVWEMIGRSIVVARNSAGLDGQSFRSSDEDCIVGVIARSAGVWDNDKTVCSCSGKTVWEERREQTERGMF